MSISFAPDSRIDACLAEQSEKEAVAPAPSPRALSAKQIAQLRLRELYWTVTRLIGLGRLHDGSRPPVNPRHDGRPRLTRSEAAKHRAVLSAPARLFIDVTPTFRFNARSGIQRVVREIARRAARSGVALPVLVENGAVVPLYAHPSLPATIEFRAGDAYLMIDACWGIADEYLPVAEKLAAAGAKFITAVHDIIPLRQPLCADPSTLSTFPSWFETFVMRSDAVICVSRNVAEDVVDYLTKDSGRPVDTPFGWFSLGADFTEDHSGPVCAEVRAICAGATPFFLSVGTLEPRKAYPVAIGAFEQLWQAGVEARYVIVGRKGWRSDALETQIRLHPQFGRRLFWLDDANDAELRRCYARARGLVYPSLAEGFGLPLVEAGRQGLPVVASDLPVFREIAGDYVRYFSPMNSVELAAAIEETLRGPWRKEKMPVPDWDEATTRLIELIMQDAYQLPVARNSAAEATLVESSPIEAV